MANVYKKMPTSPSRVDANARVLPSGLQAGSTSVVVPLLIGVSLDEVASAGPGQRRRIASSQRRAHRRRATTSGFLRRRRRGQDRPWRPWRSCRCSSTSRSCCRRRRRSRTRGECRRRRARARVQGRARSRANSPCHRQSGIVNSDGLPVRLARVGDHPGGRCRAGVLARVRGEAREADAVQGHGENGAGARAVHIDHVERDRRWGRYVNDLGDRRVADCGGYRDAARVDEPQLLPRRLEDGDRGGRRRPLDAVGRQQARSA